MQGKESKPTVFKVDCFNFCSVLQKETKDIRAGSLDTPASSKTEELELRKAGEWFRSLEEIGKTALIEMHFWEPEKAEFWKREWSDEYFCSDHCHIIAGVGGVVNIYKRRSLLQRIRGMENLDARVADTLIPNQARVRPGQSRGWRFFWSIEASKLEQALRKKLPAHSPCN